MERVDSAHDGTTFVSNIKHFNWVEYVVFFGMLSVSVLIGVYQGFKPKKHEVTTEDYMLGGKNMSIFPIAMSLVAGFISGITLLGLPAETFYYGTQLWAICIAIFISYLLLEYFYLPVVYNLQCKSLFEYLEKRFDKSVRTVASSIYAVSLILYIPVVIYVPSLAFNQVTGMPLYFLAPLICIVCIFYTSIGGLKAVVYSDTLQSICTFLGILTVTILGIKIVGGFERIIDINLKGERIEVFNMDPDPFKRNTFWTSVLGSIPNWLITFAAHPSTVQRYMSVPSYRHARIVAFIMCVGVILIKTFVTFIGLIMYAKYSDCDPLITKNIQKQGQILPYYIMDVASDYPGLAGLFLAGVVCTALSTMSTGLNTVSCTVYEDLLKPILQVKLKDKTANLIMQSTVVVFGIACTLMVFIVQKLGTILQIAIGLQGLTNGVIIFIFSFGMFIPWGNTKGALAGSLSGLVTLSLLVTKAYLYQIEGLIQFGTKVTTVDNCPGNLTLSLGLNTTTFGYPGEGTVVFNSEEVPAFYKISYLYYSTIGFIVSFTVAIIVSLLTGVQDPTELDPNLVIPQVRSFVTKGKKQKPSMELYSVVATKENTIQK